MRQNRSSVEYIKFIICIPFRRSYLDWAHTRRTLQQRQQRDTSEAYMQANDEKYTLEARWNYTLVS